MNPFVSTRRVIRCVAGGQCAEGLNPTERVIKSRGEGRGEEGGGKSRALHSDRLLIRATDPIAMADLRISPWRTDPRLNSLFLEHPWSRVAEFRDVYSTQSRLNIFDLGIEGSKLVGDHSCAH